MNSRMEKYNELNPENMSRTKRNVGIYSSIDMSDFSRIKTNNNVSVISDAPKQIDMDKIRKYINSMNEDTKEKRVSISLDDYKEENVLFEKKEAKDYDINSVLERARDSRERDYNSQRYKKIDNSEYNILKRIKVEDKKEEQEELLNDLNTEEKTIVNLINDLSKTKSMKKEDLFSELMGDNENTVVLGADQLTNELTKVSEEVEKSKRPLEELTRDLMMENEKLKSLIKENDEIDKPKTKEIDEEDTDTDNDDDEETVEIRKMEIKGDKEGKMGEIDKSFFTNSLSFSRKDFEDADDFYEEEGSSFFSKFAIILIILILIATLVIIANYVFDLNWF